MSVVLDMPLPPNGAGAETVRDYLKALLVGVWESGEGFSGKRPFGESGWQYELLDPLIGAGLASSKTEAYGLVREAIKAL